MQGWWRLEEESGTRYDGSPNGNHLADHDTVGWGTGQIGRAADFEAGNGEYLSISDTVQSGLDVTGSLTLVGWMNPESLDSLQILAARYEYGVTNRAYRFDVREDDTLALIVSR